MLILEICWKQVDNRDVEEQGYKSLSSDSLTVSLVQQVHFVLLYQLYIKVNMFVIVAYHYIKGYFKFDVCFTVIQSHISFGEHMSEKLHYQNQKYCSFIAR